MARERVFCAFVALCLLWTPSHAGKSYLGHKSTKLGATTIPLPTPAITDPGRKARHKVQTSEKPKTSANKAVAAHTTTISTTSPSYAKSAVVSTKAATVGLSVYTPANTSALDPDDFGNFIYSAMSNPSIPGVVLTAGTYSVTTPYAYKSFILYIPCPARTTPFELNLAGSRLNFGNLQQGAISFDGCTKLNVHGPVTVTYADSQLPFSQGVIQSIDNTQSPAVFTVQVDNGYPTDSLLLDNQGHLAVAYGTNGMLVQNASDIYTNVFTANGGGSYTFSAYVPPTILPGQKIAIRGNQGNHGLYLYNVTQSTFSQITMYTAAVFGIADILGSGNAITNNNIIPDPVGINGIPRLLSTNADGIHSLGAVVGPTITNNKLSNTGDDGIAVHGSFLLIAGSNMLSRTLTVASYSCNTPSCLPYAVGDIIEVYSKTLQFVATTTLQKIATIANPGQSGVSTQTPLANYATMSYFTFTVSSFPTSFVQYAVKDALVATTTQVGAGFTVSGNTVSNNRARGLLIKASNGLVGGNTIQMTSLWGILLAPELYFLESDFNHNLVVQNNVVNVTYGGIFFSALNGANNPVPYSTGLHKNVTLTGNTILNAAYAPLTVTSANVVTVSGNTITNALCYPFVYENGFSWIPAKTIVYANYITTGTFKANTFSNSAKCGYANYASPYKKGSSLSGVTFA